VGLSDTKLKSLKGKPKRYEVADEHGMFAEVMPSGSIAFRYRYWLGGKKQKVTIGAYPAMSLAAARLKHSEYRTLVEQGKSPAQKKQADKRVTASGETLRDFGKAWLEANTHRPKWQAVQRFWLEGYIYPSLGNRNLRDVTAGDVLTLLDSIKARGAPHSALTTRSILRKLYAYAIGRQQATINPAAQIPSTAIHTPVSRARTLDEKEIRSAFEIIEAAGASRQSKLALRLILLTMVRKSELIAAKIGDIDLSAAEWNIPVAKNGRPHVVYLSRQAMDIVRELKTLAGASQWLIPSLSDPRKPLGRTTLNSVLSNIESARKQEDKPWARFTVHDLRRTASTLFHEQGFDPLVVEKALNHTVKGVAGVYNRAQYAEQRREMRQHWADYIDAVQKGGSVIAFRRKA